MSEPYILDEIARLAKIIVSIGEQEKETMDKEHHFVVTYSEKNKEWKWDVDVEEARFDEGTIFNYDTNEWSSGYLGDGEYEPNEEILVDQLKRALWTMNLVNGAYPQGEK
jgi:hypothetical protein